MMDEIVRYLVLASTSSAAAVLVVEGLRRRLAGARFDRHLREQHP